METKIACHDCFQIICKQCGWIATPEDVIMIQQGKVTACPLCGWKPQPSQEKRTL